MKPKSLPLLIGATAIATLAAGAIGLTQIATATNETGNTASIQQESSVETPELEEVVDPHRPGGLDGDTFYSPHDTAILWKRHIKTITAPLPTKVRFPEKMRSFEEPTDGDKHWIQDGMIPQLAAEYWKCAWMEVAVEALKAGDNPGYENASATASTWLDILPGLEKHKENLRGIEGQIRTSATERGLTFEERDIQVHCTPSLTERIS